MLMPSQLYIAMMPVDMRIGVDGLSLKVQESLGRAPCDGSAYVFRNKTATRIKVVVWDGTGVWLCLRRLHQGRFIWPQNGDKLCVLSQAQWQWLITGVDWTRLSASAPSAWRV
jgi:transposase